MNNTFIKKLEKEEDILETRMFSVFDHILSSQESRLNIMSYQQAVEEDDIQLYHDYKKIYINGFSQFYELYKKEFVVYTIYANKSELPEYIDFNNTILYENGIETFYKCKDIKDFINLIIENSKENYPFKNILFSSTDIFIEFNFDFTFLIKSESKEKNIVDQLENIFINNGFYRIP